MRETACGGTWTSRSWRIVFSAGDLCARGFAGRPRARGYGLPQPVLPRHDAAASAAQCFGRRFDGEAAPDVGPPGAPDPRASPTSPTSPAPSPARAYPHATAVLA